MSVLRFQQPCAPRADRRGTLRARLRPRDRNHGGAHARPRGVVDLSRRRHAIVDAAAYGRRHSRCDRQALARRRRRRGHAGGQSHQRRGHALSRLSRGRRQPGVARRAGARRRIAEGTGTPAYRARSAGCGCDCAHGFRAIFVRSDLRPPRPDASDVGAGAKAGDLGSGRTSVALSTYHRTGDAVLRAACRGQTEDAG